MKNSNTSTLKNKINCNWNDEQLYSKCIKATFPTTQFGRWSSIPDHIKKKYTKVPEQYAKYIKETLEQNPHYLSCGKGFEKEKEKLFRKLFSEAVIALEIDLPKLRRNLKQDIDRLSLEMKINQILAQESLQVEKQPAKKTRPAISFDHPTLTRIPSSGLKRK